MPAGERARFRLPVSRPHRANAPAARRKDTSASVLSARAPSKPCNAVHKEPRFARSRGGQSAERLCSRLEERRAARFDSTLGAARHPRSPEAEIPPSCAALAAEPPNTRWVPRPSTAWRGQRTFAEEFLRRRRYRAAMPYRRAVSQRAGPYAAHNQSARYPRGRSAHRAYSKWEAALTYARAMTDPLAAIASCPLPVNAMRLQLTEANKLPNSFLIKTPINAT